MKITESGNSQDHSQKHTNFIVSIVFLHLSLININDHEIIKIVKNIQ